MTDKIRRLAERRNKAIAEIGRAIDNSAPNFNNKLRRDKWNLKDLEGIAKACNAKLIVEFQLNESDEII